MTAEVSASVPRTPSNGGWLRKGGGRPPKSKAQLDALKRVRDAAPELITALVKSAQKGNVRAIELALAYAVGKPVDRVEMSGPDGGPIEYSESLFNDHETQALVQAAREYLAAVRTGQDAGVAEDGAVAVPSTSEAGPAPG